MGKSHSSITSPDLLDREPLLPDVEEVKACLVALRGLGSGKWTALPTTQVIIGRSRSADLYFPHTSLSRKHATLCVEGPGKATFRDLGSTNGSFINDQRVYRERLVSCGDRIQLGQVIFKLLIGGELRDKTREALFSLVTHDALTCALSHAHFVDLFTREVGRARRHTRPLSIVLLDIDNLDRINHDKGPVFGDRIMRAVALRLQDALGEEAQLARLKEDEFGYMLPESPRLDAIHKSREIRAVINDRPFELDGSRIKVSVTAAVAAMEECILRPTGKSDDNPEFYRELMLELLRTRMKRAKQ